jgi:cytoskeletal protein CcmA (bactofilin family)
MIFDKKPVGTVEPFSKAGSPIPRTIPAQHGLAPRAVIDASLNIEGDLATDGDIQVDGHISGNVSCACLTVGKDGTISGDIKVKEIVVRGKVKGTIRATRIMLMESADVTGDIFYDRMSMEEGAHFVGASNAETIESLPRPAACPADTKDSVL